MKSDLLCFIPESLCSGFAEHACIVRSVVSSGLDNIWPFNVVQECRRLFRGDKFQLIRCPFPHGLDFIHRVLLYRFPFRGCSQDGGRHVLRFLACCTGISTGFPSRLASSFVIPTKKPFRIAGRNSASRMCPKAGRIRLFSSFV